MSSFSVHLLKMAKKRNSTKQPEEDAEGGYGGVKTMCTLRGPCGVVNPVLEFHNYAERGKLLDGFNYCYIPNFRRFYYIDDWIYDGPLIIAYCKCDVLASFKNNIESSSQYVVRSESDFDNYIIDTFYPATSDIDRYCITREEIPEITKNFNTGTYALTFLCDTATDSGLTSQGATTTVLLSSDGVESLIKNLFKDVSYMAIDEMSDAMVKALVNPLQYVVGLKYYPLRYQLLKDKSFLCNYDKTTLKLGHWNVGAIKDARMVMGSANTYEFTVAQFSFHEHPQSYLRGQFLNSPIYSKHTLSLPYYGDFEIAPDYANEYSSFSVKLRIDLLTGEAHYHIELLREESTDHLAFISVNIGANVLLAQQTQDVLGWATSVSNGVLGIAGSALRGNIEGVVNHALNGIESATRAQYPSVSSVGVNGSALESYKPVVYIAEHFKICEDCADKYGKPLCKKRVLGNLSGFIMCRNSTVTSSGALMQELEEINNQLDAGFYYE